MRCSVFAFVFASVLGLGSGCGGPPEPALVDCDALAAEQPACMDAAAIADCEDANERCAAQGGDVIVAESCPLQFSCTVE